MTGTRALPSRLRPQAGRGRSLLATGAVLTALVGAGLLAPATASATPAHPPAGHHPPAATDVVQRDLDALVSDDGFPAALAAVSDGRGRVRDLVAGVGDVATGAPVPVNGQVRIASNTKTFTATVVLQLVGEGRVGLDQPIERYLPGLVRGEGIDGRQITVRQLLQHTSGLPDYDQVLVPGWIESGFTQHYTPAELVATALSQPALAAPGAAFSYSNTNYVLAGMLIEEVTGRSVGQEITRRLITPLGLRQTYFPAADELGIRGPHPHAYFSTPTDPTLVDVTDQDSSMAWSAGQLVSTPRDLLRFDQALIGGRVLPPALLAQMQTTVPAPDESPRGPEAYGLGLQTFTLSCGGVAWGHGGDTAGTETRNAVTADGRGAVVAITGQPTSLDQIGRVEQAVDDAICAQPRR